MGEPSTTNKWCLLNRQLVVNNNPNISKKKSKTYLNEHKSKEKYFIMTLLIVFMQKNVMLQLKEFLLGSQNSRKWNENCLQPFDNVTKSAQFIIILLLLWRLQIHLLTSYNHHKLSKFPDIVRFQKTKICLWPCTTSRSMYNTRKNVLSWRLKIHFQPQRTTTCKKWTSYTKKKVSVVHWTSVAPKITIVLCQLQHMFVK